MTMVLKGGASTDPAGKAGLATLAADLATKGTRTRTAGQIAAEMEALGASLNTSAGADGLLLSVSAPAANLEAAGRILADIVQNASFPAAELEREGLTEVPNPSVLFLTQRGEPVSSGGIESQRVALRLDLERGGIDIVHCVGALGAIS